MGSIWPSSLHALDAIREDADAFDLKASLEVKVVLSFHYTQPLNNLYKEGRNSGSSRLDIALLLRSDRIQVVNGIRGELMVSVPLALRC